MTGEAHAQWLRIRCEQVHGYWCDAFQVMLDLDPEFFAEYVDLADSAWRANGLDENTKWLVLIARDAAVTHLREVPLRLEIRAALNAGVSQGDIAETLELVSVVGIHAATVGIPILRDTLGGGAVAEHPPLTRELERIKAAFVSVRGYWDAGWDDLLTSAPEFFESYTAFSGGPFLRGRLPAKVREFVYIAIDASCTHLYSTGTRIHARNAIELGASFRELAHVLLLLSTMGVQSCAVGMPLLVEEVARRGR